MIMGTPLVRGAMRRFDLVALPVEVRVEGGKPFSRRHQPDVGHCSAFGKGVAQAVAVMGTVGEQGLALGQFQPDRASKRIDQGMDFRGQAAARATHGPKADKMIRGIILPEAGSAPFFGPLAPCW